jgi:hypothetical protein
MNLKLSDHTLRWACRELYSQSPWMSGRQVRAALHARFGSAGRADRVYQIWRSIRTAQAPQPPGPEEPLQLARDLQQALEQITLLQTALFDAEQRALRAEERERLHQDRWATEIYELRQRLYSLDPTSQQWWVDARR